MIAPTMTLVPGDPLAHRALESLLRAEASVRRRLSADLEREGISASGFSVLVVLTTAGGALRLRPAPEGGGIGGPGFSVPAGRPPGGGALGRRARRPRRGTSKPNATGVVGPLEARGLVARSRLEHDRRAAAVALTAGGHDVVE